MNALIASLVESARAANREVFVSKRCGDVISTAYWRGVRAGYIYTARVAPEF